MKAVITCLLLPVLLSSCAYLEHVAKQADHLSRQLIQPRQVNLKRLIDRDTYFIVGKTVDESERYANIPMAIAAYSDRFKANERVDTMFFQGTGTHFGLSLPEGNYRLRVFADINQNQVFEHTEAVGHMEIVLSPEAAPTKVVGTKDIELGKPWALSWPQKIAAPRQAELRASLYYPAGTIRTLDDPIFDPKIATLGMYDPASFLLKSPTMFFALEEDVSFKIPVVFVHGINGSARSFQAIIDKMDRRRYKPWFFYYPSGADLEQMGALFYKIFLSGKVAPSGSIPMIIVAHSMGGLLVREAINLHKGSQKETKLRLLTTIASPLGGHPGAALGVKHGLIVLPAWRDLSPGSPFISNLYRKPLPELVDHQLFFAFDNASAIKIGSNSDGVVPIASQLPLAAQKQASGQFGFESGHDTILENPAMITHLLSKMADVKMPYPDKHQRFMRAGGYTHDLDDAYSPIAKHSIRTVGKYLRAVATGEVEPVNDWQRHLAGAYQGKVEPRNNLEAAFLRFLRQYPALSSQ